MEDGDLEALRRKLAARKDMCWERLEDAVLELSSLHQVDEEEIVDRVRAAIDPERVSTDVDP